MPFVQFFAVLWHPSLPVLFAVFLLLVTFYSTLFFNKNVVFPTQAKHSYFSADFRLKIFLHYS